MGAAVAVRAGRALRGVSGVLAGGLVALLVALGVACYLASRTGTAGPTPALLGWHAAAAVAAVLAQRYADRHPGPAGALAAAGVAAITAAVLTFLWLA